MLPASKTHLPNYMKEIKIIVSKKKKNKKNKTLALLRGNEATSILASHIRRGHVGNNKQAF